MRVKGWKLGFWGYLNIVSTSTAVIVWLILGWMYFTDRDRTAIPSITLPTPIVEVGVDQFEHCIITDNTGDSFRAEVGTPVPTIVVQINTPVPQPTEVPAVIEPNLIPTETEIVVTVEPTPVPTEVPVFDPKIKNVVQVGDLDEGNYHIVLIGVGYDDTTNQNLMINTIMGLNRYFNGVHVDFSYVENPIMAEFAGVDQATVLSESDSEILFKRIRKIAPADTMLLLVNTNHMMAVSRIQMDRAMFVALTGELGSYVASHEVAHALGLSDGYNEYIPKQIPGSELFYEDEMPKFLVRALDELGYVPPVYLAGTCNGKQLLRFWPATDNIMSGYNPDGPYPWGESVFTPLQVVIMNQFIQDVRK